MAIETNSEQIKNFTFEIVGSRPDRRQRIERRIFSAKPHLNPNPLFVRDRKQVVDHLKTRFRRMPVHASDVGKVIKRASGIFFQQCGSLADHFARYVDRHLVAIKFNAFDCLRVPAQQTRYCGMTFELFDIGDRRSERH